MVVNVATIVLATILPLFCHDVNYYVLRNYVLRIKYGQQVANLDNIEKTTRAILSSPTIRLHPQWMHQF